MAKRRKLNRRVAALLGAMGVVLVALVVGLAVKGVGGGPSLLDRFFPKDPVALLKQARAAAEERRYDAAARTFREAIGAAIRSDRGEIVAAVPQYYYEYGQFCRDWALAPGTTLTKTEKGERFHDAVDAMRKALGRDSKYVDAQRLLGELYWLAAAGDSQGRGWSDFIREASALIQLKPDEHLAYWRRGVAKASLAQQMPGELAKEAIADFNKAIELKTDEDLYWITLIQFLRQLGGRAAEVEDAYQRAVAANTANAALLVSYAEFLRQEGNNAAAEQRIQEAIKADPMGGTLALAAHHTQLNRLDEAIKTLEDARKIDRLDPRPYLEQADILARRNRPQEAVTVLKEGLAVVEEVASTQPATAPRHRQIDRQRGQLYYLLANALLDMTETDDKEQAARRPQLVQEARDCLQKLTVLNIDAAYRAKIDGRIALAEGDFAKALAQLEEAYAGFRSFDLKTGNLLIALYLRQNLPGKAEGLLDRLLSMPGQRNNVSALLAKTRLLMRYRSYDKAAQVVSLILKLDPNNAEAQNTRLVLSAVGGETPALPANVEPAPLTVRMLLDRATALWMDAQRDAAVRYVEQLRQRLPKDDTVAVRLASMYRAQNRIDDAERVLKEALKDRPDDKGLQARLELIRQTDPIKQRDVLLKMADDLSPLQRALEKANIWATFGQEKEYFQQLQEAAQIDPDAPGVVDRLFRYAVYKKDWKLAEECLGRARKANLDGGEGRLYEAQLALARKDYDAALAAAKELLKARPNRKDGRVLLGQAYLEKKSYDEAYDAFRIVAKDDPGYAPALIGLAVVTAAQGKVSEHRDYVQRAYRLAPGDPYVRERHMAIQEETARPQELIAQRERMLKQEPNDLRNLVSLGTLYEQVGQLDKAEAMFASLYQKNPNKLYGARVLGGFYYRRRRFQDIDRLMSEMMRDWPDRLGTLVFYGELLTTIDPERAGRSFEQAVAADPEDPRGYLAMARYRAGLRQWSQAVQAMDRYVRLRPEDPAGVEDLVRYLIEAGEYALASNRLDAILANDPTDAGALTLKGALAVRQGQVQKAFDMLAEAIRVNPSYEEPLIFRAQLYLAQGDPVRGRADLQAAVRLSSRPDIAFRLGLVHVTLREYDEAERVYRDILRSQRDYVPAMEQLAQIYQYRQKWNDLEKLLKEARDLFPKDPRWCVQEAAMWEAREDQTKRLAALDEGLNVAPGDREVLRRYLLALQQAGQHDRILTVSEKYLPQADYVAWVAAIRGASLVKLNRPQEAETLFVKACENAQVDQVMLVAQQIREAYGAAAALANFGRWLAARPKDWRLHLMMGVLQGEAKEMTKAVEELTQARNLAEDRQAKYLAERFLGYHHYEMRNYADAEKAYLAALQYQPNDIQVLNNLGYLYTDKLNEPKKALPYAAEAARRLPGHPSILDTYGWTLAKIGRLADAEQYLLRAVQSDSPLPASRYHLGWVYEQLGRFDEAMKQYRQGFEMLRSKPDDPHYELLRDGLERVRKKLPVENPR